MRSAPQCKLKLKPRRLPRTTAKAMARRRASCICLSCAGVGCAETVCIEDGFSLAPGVSISNASDVFLYNSIGRRRSLIFDPEGHPVWIMNAGADVYRLLDGTVTLSDGDNQLNVVIAPITGRVTVQ